MDELYTMPFILFIYLYVFTEIVNPDNARIDQIRHTEMLQAIYLHTGNVSKEHLSKFALGELDSLNLISSKTLREQAEEREKRIAEQEKNNMLSWMRGHKHG
ncbi:hypothetical protein ACOJEA_004779 [Klebsiella aerogenes]